MFQGGLRLSEVVGSGMGDFSMRSNLKSSEQRWCLRATGKGNKDRLIPATAELMSYRRALELSDLPQSSEPSLFVFPVAWRRSIHPSRPGPSPSA